ncbi:hypothetical protein LMIY3S_01097 [Labrys miyagiensis]
MSKLIITAAFLAGSLLVLAGASQAASRPAERHPEEQNARAECILPWYRFFGACDEAIDDYPYGNHWHDWNNRHHHHGHWR